MSAPFFKGWGRRDFWSRFKVPARALQVPEFEARGRIIGFSEKERQPIVAPSGHSLLQSAAGTGKTVHGASTSLFSLAASYPEKAHLVMDSKDGELAAQCAAMLAAYGRKVAIIDDMGVFAHDNPFRVSINPLGSIIASYKDNRQDLVFASENANQAIIAEPPNDARNQWFRDCPRTIIEFALYVLLKRNPRLATVGAVWQIIANPKMLRKFATIEAEEAEGLLQVMALNVLEMMSHDQFAQHREAALKAMRIFSVGSRLHDTGVDASITHAELIRQGYIIFLVGPQAFMNRLSAYYSLQITAFNDALYSGAGPLLKILDEFTNCPLKSLVEAITTERGYGGENHMIAQSRSEIERRFGKLECETIEENAIVKQWFGFSSFTEAERISRAAGEEHIINHSLSTDDATLRLQHSYQMNKERNLSAARLMSMAPDEQLIWVKHVGFFIAKKLGQHQILPFCDDIAPNRLEGGKLTPDPMIRLNFARHAA